MLERYFAENDVKIEAVKDNGTSITFTCSHPSWTEQEAITLSDLGIAKALGLDTTDMSRDEFIQAVKEQFPIPANHYFIKEWEFPIPKEWEENARSNVYSMVDRKLFNSISIRYVQDLEPPLFGLCFLKTLKKMCEEGITGKPEPLRPDLAVALQEPKKYIFEPYYNEVDSYEDEEV